MATSKNTESTELMNRFKIPQHKFTWVYYLFFITVFLFGAAAVSGLLLLPYYQGTVTEATHSLYMIDRLVPYGHLVRNFHTWVGSILIGTVILMIMSAFVFKSYTKPRELTWLSGLVVIFFTILAGYSGHILPWNELSVSSTKVSMSILTSTTEFLPAPLSGIGAKLAEFLIGGTSLDQATLSRFFALHIFIVPFILMVLLTIHIQLIFRHGLSANEVEITGEPMGLRKFVLRACGVCSILLAVILIIAQALPFDSFLTYEMKVPFDENLPTPIGVRPEWYLLFISYTIRIIPQEIFLAIFTVLGGLVAFAPWVFPKVSRRIHMVIAAAVGTYIIIMTIWGPNIIEMVKGTSH